MKKNKPPLTAPVPVNVQRAARPPLVSATGEKHERLRCHKLHVDLPFPPTGPIGTQQRELGGGDGGRWRIICVSV